MYEISREYESISLKNIDSDDILKKIVDNMSKIRLLKIIEYNKLFQEKLNIGIDDYKQYYKGIKIELITNNKNRNYFINIKEEDKPYYHIYIKDNKKKVKKNILIIILIIKLKLK